MVILLQKSANSRKKRYPIRPPLSPRQYCGQPHWLRNCGLKKVAELQSATLYSLLQVPLLFSPFSSAQDNLKNQPKIFLELYVSIEAKNLPEGDSSMRFFTSDFFHESTGFLIHTLNYFIWGWFAKKNRRWNVVLLSLKNPLNSKKHLAVKNI
jgi:hypothetical protein